MGNISTANESDPEVLESYFQKYPDVPKETILKQHLLSLGHWFSDAALKATEGALVKSYRLFSYDLVPMSEFKRGEHRRVPEHFVVLNGPYGLKPVAIQTSLSPHSPYLIDVVDGRLVLTTEGRVIADIRFPKPPDYYAESLPDGTPYHEIVAFGTFITIFRNCQYWGAKEECKFCDINENVRQMKLSRDFTLTAPVKSVEDVVRVVEAVTADARSHDVAAPGFLVSGGTITKTLHGKTEPEFYGEYVPAIHASAGVEDGGTRGPLAGTRRWGREPPTPLCTGADPPPVPLNIYILLIRNWYEPYQKYRSTLPRFGTRKPGLLPERNLLGPVHGAYGDFVLITDKLHPADIEEQINRRSVPFENLEGGPGVS